MAIILNSLLKALQVNLMHQMDFFHISNGYVNSCKLFFALPLIQKYCPVLIKLLRVPLFTGLR